MKIALIEKESGKWHHSKI